MASAEALVRARRNLEAVSLRIRAGIVLDFASLAAHHAVADARIGALRELPEEGPGVPARMVRVAERTNLANAEQRLVCYVEAFLACATEEAVHMGYYASDVTFSAEAFGRQFGNNNNNYIGTTTSQVQAAAAAAPAPADSAPAPEEEHGDRMETD